MTDWLWEAQRQTASILIFVAGESEAIRMKNAIKLSKELKRQRWFFDVQMIWGSCPSHVEGDARDRLEEHDFGTRGTVLFTIITAGKGEDGWTPGPMA